MIYSVTNALLNSILVSIPEETFIVVMTLIFLKKDGMLDIRMWRQNIKWIMIPALPVVILINVGRYIIFIPKPVITILGYLLMNVFMVYIVFKNKEEDENKLLFRTILSTFGSFFIVLMVESIYIPIILFLTKTNVTYFNNNILYNFLLALPGRVLEYSICIYFIIKRNNSLNINLFKTITNNRFLSISFSTMIIFFNMYLFYFLKLICFDNILEGLKINEQLLIVILSISLPIISVTWFLLIINYILVKQKQIQQTYENLVMQDHITDVEN